MRLVGDIATMRGLGECLNRAEKREHRGDQG